MSSTAASLPLSPLSAASTATGSVPCRSRNAASAVSFGPCGQLAERRGELLADGPVRCRQRASARPRGSDGCGSRSQRSDRRESPTRARRATDRRAPRVTVAGSMLSIPSRVHSACSLVRGIRRARPRASAARSTTDLSLRSTSRRCAVSRHQPFGCESVSTSARGASPSTAPDCRPRRVVSCTTR